MKRFSLALLCFALLLPACDASSQATRVTDFSAPDLVGLVVTDHPRGARIVQRPAGDTAPPGLGGPVQPGGIITGVNGTPVRDAEHLRELVNGLHRRGEERNMEVTWLAGEVITRAAGADVLEGTVVRDHADGVEVVTSPRYAAGDLFVEVDGTAVRGERHFHSLVAASERRGGELMLVSVPAADRENWKRNREPGGRPPR